MSDRIELLLLIDRTVVEKTFEAERITYQRLDGGVQINIWRGGVVVEQFDYERAPVVHRILDTEHLEEA